MSSNNAPPVTSDTISFFAGHNLAGYHLARRCGWITLITFSLMFVGCRTEHDDHDEESHFPPHWPKSFLAAADRLEQISTNPASTPSLAESIEQELTDLIDWLPELIADSDLSKEEFDKVDGWAFPLAIELKQSVKAGKKLDELLKNEVLREGLSGLAELASQTKKRQAELKAREEQEEAEAKRISEENSQPLTPIPEGN